MENELLQGSRNTIIGQKQRDIEIPLNSEREKETLRTKNRCGGGMDFSDHRLSA